MLHTMYGQALRHSSEFFIEYFAIDLIMDEKAAAAWLRSAWTTALSTASRAQTTIIATGGYGRAYSPCTSAHTCTGDGNAMVCARDCRYRTWSSCGSIRPVFMARGV
jgi:succinate dehydrogenase / fumarate reductase flavoprotein subunit